MPVPIREGVKGFGYKHNYDKAIERSMYNTQLQMKIAEKQKEDAKKLAEDMTMWDATDPVSSKKYDLYANQIMDEMTSFFDQYGDNWEYDPTLVAQYNKITHKFLNNNVIIEAQDYQKNKMAYMEAASKGELDPEEDEMYKQMFKNYESQADLITSWDQKTEVPRFSNPIDVNLYSAGIDFSKSKFPEKMKSTLRNGRYVDIYDWSEDDKRNMSVAFYSEHEREINKEFVQYQEKCKARGENPIYTNPIEWSYNTYVDPNLQKEKLGSQYVNYGAGRGSSQQQQQTNLWDQQVYIPLVNGLNRSLMNAVNQGKQELTREEIAGMGSTMNYAGDVFNQLSEDGRTITLGMGETSFFSFNINGEEMLVPFTANSNTKFYPNSFTTKTKKEIELLRDDKGEPITDIDTGIPKTYIQEKEYKDFSIEDIESADVRFIPIDPIVNVQNVSQDMVLNSTYAGTNVRIPEANFIKMVKETVNNPEQQKAIFESYNINTSNPNLAGFVDIDSYFNLPYASSSHIVNKAGQTSKSRTNPNLSTATGAVESQYQGQPQQQSNEDEFSQYEIK